MRREMRRCGLRLHFLLFILFLTLLIFPSELTAGESGLWINKTTDLSSYAQGENVTYTISYGNNGSENATDVTVMDLLPKVELLYMDPPASSLTGNNLTWNIGVLNASENHSITLIVKLPDVPNLNFNEESSVSGYGYVNIRRRSSTLKDNSTLTNIAVISGIYNNSSSRVNSSVTVKLGVRPVSNIKSMEHGSGRYQEEQGSSLNNTVPSQKLKKDLSATRDQVALGLPGNRTLAMNSPWSDRTSASTDDNGTVSIVSDEYRYMDSIDKETSYDIIGNTITYASTGNFSRGMAHLGYIAKTPDSRKDVAYISESYHGSFQTEQSLSSSGSSPSYKKETSGRGSVSAQKIFGCRMRSYEHGSGDYESAESIQGGSVQKTATMTYQPNEQHADGLEIDYASKWGEAMYANDAAKGTEILNRISSADYIQKEALMSASFLSMTGRFNGTDHLLARQASGKRLANETFRVEQFLVGDYRLDASIGLAQSLKYNYPHINLTKRVLARSDDTFTYRIWINNDGAKTLEQVAIVDLLPEEATFISSTLQPVVQGRVVSWTLQAVPAGETMVIDVKVHLAQVSRAAINRVQAAAIYQNLTLVSKAEASPYDTIVAQTITNESIELEEATSHGDWRLPSCFNLNPGPIGCEKEIDDYYKNLTDECGDLP